jgi:LacI family transcriptional regulator
MAITVKDVAIKAGVSTATVSRVINGEKRIREETRQKVFDSMKKLNYQINSIARSLKINKTFTIGMITTEMTNDFFMSVAEGVERELHENGYSLLICSSNESVEGEKDRIRLMLEKCVDGIIIIASSNQGSHFNSFAQHGIPAVLIDRLVDDFTSDAVLADNSDGSYRAIEYLIGRGIRRIGFIGGDMRLTPARERYEGYKKALKDHNIPEEEKIIKFGDFHIQSGYDIMKEIIENDPELSNVFISNYYMHLGAMKYLQENRSDLKRGITIASFDDMYISSILGYSCVRVRQPVLEMGTKATDLLLSRIRNEDIPYPMILRLKTELIKD